MRIIYSDMFKKSVQTLTMKEKTQVKKKLLLFLENPRHPSLRTKKMAGYKNIYESSINMDIRMTWQYIDDGVLLRNIGHHDSVLDSP